MSASGGHVLAEIAAIVRSDHHPDRPGDPSARNTASVTAQLPQ